MTDRARKRQIAKPSSSPSGALPTSKVAAGGAAGALTVVLVWLLGALGVDMPPEVASALTVLLSTAAAYYKSGKGVTL